MAIDVMLKEFADVASNPMKMLKQYKAAGKKAIGVLPYYAPEELVYAAGMVPFGIWGSNNKTISKSKEYCATFYCTIAQLALEMLLDGTMDDLDGVITPTICDTLRPMSQNFRVAMAKMKKMPTIFLAHPQYRKPQFGITFCYKQYMHVKEQLEKICGHTISNEDVLNANKVYNESRAARREFVKLAGEHADVVSAVNRSTVLKASFFMLKDEYTKKLVELNKALKALPVCNWKGAKVVTSGIICDNPTLLKIFDDNKIAIVADDVAHESRSIRYDVPENKDGVMALALQFASMDEDILLYDEQSDHNNRAEAVCKLVKDSKAGGLVLFMQTFCDPEEMEYPYLKKALDAHNIPHIKLGIDQQMRDFGQAATAIQAFADVVG